MAITVAKLAYVDPMSDPVSDPRFSTEPHAGAGGERIPDGNHVRQGKIPKAHSCQTTAVSSE
jgi:hypothetical protein